MIDFSAMNRHHMPNDSKQRLIRCFGEVRSVGAQRAIGGVLFLVCVCCGRIEKTRGSSAAFLARYHDVAGARIAAATKNLFDCLGIALMSCNNIDFVSFHFTRKYDFRLLGENSISKLRRHVVRAVSVQAKFLTNLCVGQIETHKVEAQYPYVKWLVVTSKNGSSKIIELPLAVAALVPLPLLLRFVKAAFDNMTGTANNAADTVGPASSTNLCKTLPIVHQKQKCQSHPWQPIVVQVTNIPKP